MDIILKIIISIFIVTGLAANASDLERIPHLDLEMTGKEYLKYLKEEIKDYDKLIKINSAFKLYNDSNDQWSIVEVLALGDRLHKWINFENSKRTSENQIQLSNPGNRKGFPINSPSRYSPSKISNSVVGVFNDASKEFKDVLVSTEAFPIVFPFSDAEFVTYARRLDSAYQSAARWNSLSPYKSQYLKAKQRDVRAYYDLTYNNWDKNELTDYSALDEEKKKRLKNNLIGICYNQLADNEKCLKEFDDLQSQKKLEIMYSKYIETAKKIYNSFFEIRTKRKDIYWVGSDDLTAFINFIDPKDDKIRNFVQLNVEDEFKWNDWQLKLRVGNYSKGPRIEFEKGVVPHVNKIAGDIIVMDANTSVEEFSSKWTIRHEFGHVLGLPDCYHEYYDDQTNEFVNYQIDTTDLMCSRAGNMNERIYNELRNAYLE